MIKFLTDLVVFPLLFTYRGTKSNEAPDFEDMESLDIVTDKHSSW